MCINTGQIEDVIFTLWNMGEKFGEKKLGTCIPI